MGSEITMYISLVTFSGVLCTFLGFYAYLKRKEISVARTFMIYMAVQSIYIFAFAFELSSDSLQQIKGWTIVEYIGISFAPVLGLQLIMRYIGKPLSRTATAILYVIPIITMAMVSTNEWHHWFYKSLELRENASLPLTTVVIGPWYIVHGAFTSGSLLAGVVLLASQWNKTKKAYRKQLITLICGQLFPLISALVYLMGLTPGGLDPVPFVISITSTMYIWAIITTRILTIVPIAKESIFESMRDGVIVLDSADRLIDYNAAVGKMLPGLHIGMIGKKLDEVWSHLTGLPFPAIEHLDGMREEKMETAAGTSYYQIRSSPVSSQNGMLAGRLLMLIDVTEQKLLQDQLKQLAYYDGLTKIYNRTQFIHQSKKMLRQANFSDNPVSFILFDIDYFKRINDTYGHETGDQVIVHVVSVCQMAIAPDTIFARYGGEEFVLALPSTPLHAAHELAELIRKKLENTPLTTQHGPITVTSSFGVAQSMNIRDSLESLLRDADSALYEAKRAGRNRVCLYRSKTNQE